MTIDAKTVKKIAHLARLAIDEKETERYARDLSRILDLVEQMNQADTDNIEPMAHPIPNAQRLRADEVTEKNDRDYLQKIAPETASGLYIVPAVIEQEG